MRLQSPSLRGRRFLIQYYQIMEEFGRVIPWLAGLDDLKYATEGNWFRDELARQTGNRPEGVTAYQLVDEDPAKMFIGGLLHFEEMPELFRDQRHHQLAEQLKANGSSFVSCLQIRSALKQLGMGNELMQRAIKVILRDQGPFWGVASNPQLLPWYRSLGAQTPSPEHNRDNLWIVRWEKGIQTPAE